MIDMPMAPLLPKPEIKPCPVRDDRLIAEMDNEHLELLKKVWFDVFDVSFAEDFRTIHRARSMVLFSDHISTFNDDIYFHPQITNEHYLCVAKHINYCSDIKSSVRYLVLTNACIELILMKVPYDIVEAYWNYKMVDDSKAFEHIFFRQYENMEVIE